MARKSDSRAMKIAGRERVRGHYAKMRKEALRGHRFGKLVALRRLVLRTRGNKQATGFWVCQCDCGKRKAIRHDNLTTGLSRSCGCAVVEHYRKLGRRAFG